MTLTHVEMKAFRSWRDLSLPLSERRVLIAGLNGTGKSSVRDAIKWALLGRCHGTDGRGSGAEVLIPDGTKAVDVAIGIAVIGRVARTYMEKGGSAFSVEGFTGTSQVQQEALFTKLQTSPEFIDAVLDTAVFLDLNHVTAKALVLSLLGVRIPVEESDGSKTAYTLDELDVRYKQAFEDRKVAKRNLQQHHVPPMAMGQTMPTLEAITAQLTKLRNELGSLRQSVGSASGTREALAAQLARLEDSATMDQGEDLPPVIASLQDRIAELEQSPSTEIPQTAPVRSVQFLRSRIEAIKKHEPPNGCVFDSRIDCKTPLKQFTMAAAALETELGVAEAKAPGVPVQSPLTALRKELEHLLTKQAHQSARTEVAEQAKARMRAVRQELDALPDTSEQDTAIVTLMGRIQKGEALLRQAQQHWAEVDQRTRAEEKQKTLQAEVARLEDLVDLLGPNGVRAKALSEAMGTFEAAVNPYVEPFGWKLAFSVEPWQAFANGRPVETSSRSERYRIGIALQMGIAMLSGLKFACIDETDMLDVGNRGIVTKMLLNAPLDQILILGTREPSQILPKIKGVLSYRLGKEQGRTIVCESSAEVAA